MATRQRSTVETAIAGRKADLTTSTTQREQADRRELAVIARIQQRTHFSRQGVGSSTGEASYY